jgi:hypothetical protein
VDCALLCVGAPVVQTGAGPRMDNHRNQLCELCGDRLIKVKHHRPYGPGRACRSHEEDPRRTSAPISRSKRPYETLRPTQKRERRKQAREAVGQVLEEIGCPLEAIQPQPQIPPEDLLQLTTAERERFRTVRNIHIPSEQIIIECKKKLATTNATETSTFVNGAHITDPIRFVSGLCVQSPLLVVGGDAGNGLTKLGVTYVDKEKTQSFAALLVFAGKDNYEDLSDLLEPGLTPFKGDSVGFSDIFAALQHLINTNMERAFLNGDWLFINAVLGLKAASAKHPCPICTISSSNLLGRAQYRKPKDRHSRHPDHSCLLTIDPERIVPTPLHVFLGISNRIILDVFSELLGKEVVEETLKKITTIHSAGCGGKSDLFDLNGPEIRKWLKKECCTTLLAAAAESGQVTDAQKATHSILTRWLQKLHDNLLHKKEWELKDIEAWRETVEDIQKNWCSETNQQAFPKLHMLRHALEFAERYRFLGRASEAQIESYHYQFKKLFNEHHLNMAHNTPERTRRTLADTTLRAVQPLVQQAKQ